MAPSDYAKPFVERALREGIGPTASLRAAREGGLRIQDSTWFRVYGQERNNRAIQAKSIATPLNRRPTVDEIGQWDTVRRKGYAYRVVGLLQDRETGATKTAIVTTITPNLISRGRAIRQAMDSFQDPDEKYPGVLLAAFTAGVFEMIPVDNPDEE